MIDKIVKITTVDELKEKLDKNAVTLIDVRDDSEHEFMSIDGSILIPLNEISADKIPNKSHPIIIHCQSGKRSFYACQKLLEQDPNLDVYSLEGGILEWESSGYNLNKSSRSSIPIYRQTQIAAGLIILTGTTLGSLYDESFYFFPIFVASGLIFSGLTGRCGTANLLLHMPWNK